MADAAFDFAYTYLEILQGIAAGIVRLDRPGSFLTRDVVLKIACSVPKFIGYLPENGRWALERLAELTFDKLGLSYEAGAD